MNLQQLKSTRLDNLYLYWVAQICLEPKFIRALFKYPVKYMRIFTDTIECFHSRGQHLCKFIGTKEIICMRKKLNSPRTGLGHQHGHRFFVLGHQYGHRDVMWKHPIQEWKQDTKTAKSNLLQLILLKPNRLPTFPLLLTEHWT